MRKLVMAVERWIFDDESMLLSMGKFILLILLLCAPFVAAAVVYDGRVRRECAARGGVYTAVGTRTIFMWNAATKTTMPHQVTDYECLVPR